MWRMVELLIHLNERGSAASVPTVQFLLNRWVTTPSPRDESAQLMRRQKRTA
jgi:hypothetical protein